MLFTLYGEKKSYTTKMYVAEFQVFISIEFLRKCYRNHQWVDETCCSLLHKTTFATGMRGMYFTKYGLIRILNKNEFFHQLPYLAGIHFNDVIWQIVCFSGIRTLCSIRKYGT